MKIAFVACNRSQQHFDLDPSYIYRCKNLAEALSDRGHDVFLFSLSNFSFISRFDVVVFHRPRYSWFLHVVVAFLRQRKVKLVADFDDLVFDATLASYSPGVLNGLVPLKERIRAFDNARKALTLFEHITVSTEPLKVQVKRHFPCSHVTVIPNCVYVAWQQLAISPIPQRTRERLLTYTPGTRSHDRDFRLIADVIGTLLERHPDMRLEVIGPLVFSVPARPGQVVHKDRLPFDEFHQCVRTGMINLAPLEDTPFTRCKSALKVMEAGFWNIPTVCSPLPDAERFQEAGAFVARTEKEWLSTLERLLFEPDYYYLQTTELRERVLELADIGRIANDWLAVMRES